MKATDDSEKALRAVLRLAEIGEPFTRSEVMRSAHVSKNVAVHVMNKLVEQGQVVVVSVSGRCKTKVYCGNRNYTPSANGNIHTITKRHPFLYPAKKRA